jgi:hypothetical protein
LGFQFRHFGRENNEVCAKLPRARRFRNAPVPAKLVKDWREIQTAAVC